MEVRGCYLEVLRVAKGDWVAPLECQEAAPLLELESSCYFLAAPAWIVSVTFLFGSSLFLGLPIW